MSGGQEIRYSGLSFRDLHYPGAYPPHSSVIVQGKKKISCIRKALQLLTRQFSEEFTREVRKIPYGGTCTYGEIAEKISTSPRVVGQAMRRNPTPLVIPCHRVVGKNGIGGFTPSPEIKEALLEMEKKTKQRKKQQCP